MPQPDLVTFVVMAYRQEAMVRDAIAAAFAQTHSPLQILLSDDNSPDGTFGVMQEMAAAYHGPHTVKLNRNPTNLGLIGHINRVFELAEGALLVYNAGDDISEPERSAKLFAEFQNGRPLLIHSDVTDLDPDGQILAKQRERQRHDHLETLPVERIALTKNNCIGASCAWSPELYRLFGPITETGVFEDRIFYFRARLAGSVGYVPERLVRYRRGAGLSFERGEGEAETRKNFEIDLATFRQRLKDCQHLRPELGDVIAALQRKLRKRVGQLSDMDQTAAEPEKPGKTKAEREERRRAREARQR